VIGLVDYENTWRHRPPPGLAFVGDAAVSGDPLFVVGCGWALQEAEWLADAIAPGPGRRPGPGPGGRRLLRDPAPEAGGALLPDLGLLDRQGLQPH